MEVFDTYINYSPFLCLRWKWSNGWAHISIWASFTLPFNGSHFGEWKPDITKMCTCSHTLPRHTYNIDSEGIPSSSLIQTSADGALDWMEKVREKGAMRCAGERAQGLMGGEFLWTLQMIFLEFASLIWCNLKCTSPTMRPHCSSGL